jgi:pimeloyl-ACP methyl ester carboxylesterase
MKRSGARRKILRILALGCGTTVLVFGAFVIWIGSEIYRATRPVELSENHPFRSPAKKERYLAHYDARAERWPVVSETRIVETSWGPTFVRISGPADGPPLVLLPGANATALMWETNIEAFSRDHRVYAVDNVFDFGRSVYVRNLKTPADFVSWFDELLDALGLEKTHLAGLSYGGWIASEYALEHPERVERLVLLAPAATVLQFSTDFMKKGILCLIPHKHFVKSMMYWALADAAAGTEEHRRLAEEAADNAWLGIRCFKPKQMVAPRILSDEELRGLAPPTLFLVGENEVIYSGTGADAVRRLNTVAPQIITEILPDCGHDLTLIQAELVNRRILEFLEPPPVETPD